MNVRATTCCGIRELGGIQDYDDPSEILRRVIPSLLGDLDGPYSFFSCNDESEMGDELARLINDEGLGTVTRTGYHFNVNSDNDLEMFIWTHDADAMRAWLERDAEQQRRDAVPESANGQPLTVGAEVRHTVYGIGVVRTHRTGHQANVGVEFLRRVNGSHDLNGALEDDRGKWTSANRLTVL